jgi:hypothetical protein
MEAAPLSRRRSIPRVDLPDQPLWPFPWTLLSFFASRVAAFADLAASRAVAFAALAASRAA